MFAPTPQHPCLIRVHPWLKETGMPCAPLRPLLSAILAGCVLLATPAAHTAEKRKPFSAEEAAKLKRENEGLRAENRRLRKLLAESINEPEAPEKTLTMAKASKNAGTRGSPANGEKGSGFWLSDNGKRHKAGCQYYQTSKGKPCAADQGIACKVCGG